VVNDAERSATATPDPTTTGGDASSADDAVPLCRIEKRLSIPGDGPSVFCLFKPGVDLRGDTPELCAFVMVSVKCALWDMF
jgi:hypothetical protein